MSIGDDIPRSRINDDTDPRWVALTAFGMLKTTKNGSSQSSFPHDRSRGDIDYRGVNALQRICKTGQWLELLIRLRYRRGKAASWD